MDNQELINNIIDDIISGNNTEAKQSIENILSQKLNDAIDTKKQEVASSIYTTDRADSSEKSEEETTENPE
jgi:hypothetical protein